MKQPLTVMQVIGGGPFFGGQLPIGGAAEYVSLLLQGLGAERFRHVLVFLFDGPSAQAARAAGHTVHVVRKRAGKDLAVPLRLARLIRSEGVDIVSTHLTNADFYGRLAGRLAGVRVVSTMHSFISGTMASRGQRRFSEALSWWHETRLAFLSDRIVTVCGALAAEMEARGVARRRLEVIPPGVDTSRYSPDGAAFREELGVPENATLIGSVGRLAPSKNYPALLRIAAELPERHGRTAFVIVGDGPQRDVLEAEAGRLGLGKRVIFAGWRPDIANVLPAFDLFLLTSLTEAMPISLLEAMACGKPSVVPAIGGIPEAVEDGRDAFLYPAGDYIAASSAIEKLLDDPRLCSTMGSGAARKIREQFGLDRLAARTESLYRSIVGG